MISNVLEAGATVNFGCFRPSFCTSLVAELKLGEAGDVPPVNNSWSVRMFDCSLSVSTVTGISYVMPAMGLLVGVHLHLYCFPLAMKSQSAEV